MLLNETSKKSQLRWLEPSQMTPIELPLRYVISSCVMITSPLMFIMMKSFGSC